MRKKISTVTTETDTFEDFNLRYDYEVNDGNVVRLNCNATPITDPGQPSANGNVFFNHNIHGYPTISFNQIPVDGALADHVVSELSAIVQENTVVEEEPA